MTARGAGLPAETEASFQDAVLQLAAVRGWLCAHFRPARTNGSWRTPIQGDAGFPDIVLVRPPRTLFIELKSERGRLEPAQERWIFRLQQCPGVEAHVLRPSQWDLVERLLAA